ncbi:MAG: hypothetical protein ISS35_01435 [Kiritimatiellae bacterium]|nr:hypothetical protein [Kiritimatiellia bacterium]
MSNGLISPHDTQDLKDQARKTVIRNRFYRALALLLPALTVASTLLLYDHGPPFWKLYLLYSLEFLQQPLVSLFLLLAITTLIVAILRHYRHKPELLASCFLLSALMHLLTVTFFSVWIIKSRDVTVVHQESRHEVDAGVPSFQETSMGETLRQRRTDVSPEDSRTFKPRNQKETAEKLTQPDKAEPTIPQMEKVSANRTNIKTAPPNKQPSPVKEELAPTRPTQPATDTTKMATARTAEQPQNQEPTDHRSNRKLESTPVTKPFSPQDEQVAKPEPAAPQSRQTSQSRSQPKMVKTPAPEQQIETQLQKMQHTQTTDALKLEMARQESRQTPEPQPRRPEQRRAVDVSRASPQQPIQTDTARPRSVPTPQQQHPPTLKLVKRAPQSNPNTPEPSESRPMKTSKKPLTVQELLQLSKSMPALSTKTPENQQTRSAKTAARPVNTARQTTADTAQSSMPERPQAATPQNVARSVAQSTSQLPNNTSARPTLSERIDTRSPVAPRTEPALKLRRMIAVLQADQQSKTSSRSSTSREQPSMKIARSTTGRADSRQAPSRPIATPSKNTPSPARDSTLRTNKSLASTTQARQTPIAPSSDALERVHNTSTPVETVINISGRLLVIEHAQQQQSQATAYHAREINEPSRATAARGSTKATPHNMPTPAASLSADTSVASTISSPSTPFARPQHRTTGTLNQGMAKSSLPRKTTATTSPSLSLRTAASTLANNQPVTEESSTSSPSARSVTTARTGERMNIEAPHPLARAPQFTAVPTDNASTRASFSPAHDTVTPRSDASPLSVAEALTATEKALAEQGAALAVAQHSNLIRTETPETTHTTRGQPRSSLAQSRQPTDSQSDSENASLPANTIPANTSEQRTSTRIAKSTGLKLFGYQPSNRTEVAPTLLATRATGTRTETIALAGTLASINTSQTGTISRTQQGVTQKQINAPDRAKGRPEFDTPEGRPSPQGLAHANPDSRESRSNVAADPRAAKLTGANNARAIAKPALSIQATATGLAASSASPVRLSTRATLVHIDAGTADDTATPSTAHPRHITGVQRSQGRTAEASVSRPTTASPIRGGRTTATSSMARTALSTPRSTRTATVMQETQINHAATSGNHARLEPVNVATPARLAEQVRETASASPANPIPAQIQTARQREQLTDDTSLSGYAPPPPRAYFRSSARPGAAMGSLSPASQASSSSRRNQVDTTTVGSTASSHRARTFALPVSATTGQHSTREALPRSTGRLAPSDSMTIARAGGTAAQTMKHTTTPRNIGIPATRLSTTPSASRLTPGATTSHASSSRAPGHIEDTLTPTTPARKLMIAEIAAMRESSSRKAIYQLRTPAKRKQYINELGGSEATENAVEQALDWLAKMQSPDGHWDIDTFEGVEDCGGAGDQLNADTGLTGLTLLAFLGAGYTHTQGKHQDAVRKGLEWLINGMTPEGDLRRGGQMYDQAMATAALCESLSITGADHLRKPAHQAATFIAKAQNPEAAWRYNPKEDNDTSVTGWQILALKSAEVSGMNVHPQHYQWAEKWLSKVRKGQAGGLYSYLAGHAVTPVMTAEGWFCQLFMGEQNRTRGQDESITYIMEHLPVWEPDIPGAIHFYYWYYATLSLHLSGAKEFDLWNDALTTALLRGRTTEGPAAGSWDPISHLGKRGGRVYTTAMATLCLEVYYRYLPFYKLR